MADFRPFKGVRPKRKIAKQVSSLPYDVMSREEAKAMASGSESFLHVIRSEIDLDERINPYEEFVYERARENLDSMIEQGLLIQDEAKQYYIYRQVFQGRMQTGIVGCASIDDYQADVIKKHELTRPEKEIDRLKHLDYCDAHTEPVFLMYKDNGSLNAIIDQWTGKNDPVYDFETEDEIKHKLWVIDDVLINNKISLIFNDMDSLYIADGHHRSASSVKVGLKRRKENPNYSGEEEFNFFLCVAFAEKDLYIMDYNRVVQDLNGYTAEEFLDKVKTKFDVEKYIESKPFSPQSKHTFGMYLQSKWYKLTAKPETFDKEDVVDSLDAAILQNNLLRPILGIENPRTDKRIQFVGGIRGLQELEKRVSDDISVAFSTFPTIVSDIMSVSDEGKIMPPKSTWFEPKLRSGLFIHKMK